MGNEKQKSLTGTFKGRNQKLNALQGQASLGDMYEPDEKGGFIDVVNQYPWTLSPPWIKSEAPYVVLKEFEVNEGKIMSSSLFYARQAGSAAVAQTGAVVNALTLGLFSGTTMTGDFDSLEAYQWLFPKDKPTGFRYQLPYFSEVNFNVKSAEWESLDNMEQIGSGVANTANAVLPGAGDFLTGAASMIKNYGGAALGMIGGYPKIGPTDKPKMWGSHSPRTIEIKFPLFNTVEPDDWKKNRDLCTLLVNQNLYNKRDFVTSLPPVFYEVLVPGQHYSYASCVTDITIYNRGNMRNMSSIGNNGKSSCIVPDAYEVSISLTDMTLPSKNLFQQINIEKVYTEIVKK